MKINDSKHINNVLIYLLLPSIILALTDLRVHSKTKRGSIV